MLANLHAAYEKDNDLNTHITEVCDTVVDTRGEIPISVAASGIEIRRLASGAVLEDLEVEAIDISGSTAISKGVWIEGRVVLAHCSSSVRESDRSMFDSIGRC